jgi:hypothetical protein
MKVSAVVLTAAVAACLWTGILGAEGSPTNGLAVGVLGKPDPALAGRVRDRLAVQFGAPVRLLSLPEDVNKFGEALKTARTTNDVGVLVLVNTPDPSSSVGGAIFERAGLAMLDLRPLRAKLPDKNADEVFALRAERESVRFLALALGLPPCPMSRCTLHETASPAALDTKSRNLCPPCGGKAAKALRARNVRLLRDQEAEKP